MADGFLENYTFKFPWRKYQVRVLDEMSGFLSDDKINIVAAPGAGKTVLGLELINRINKNVLILSPTITIKNQWVDRFLQLFVQDNPTPDFISSDIYSLDRFNVATYQALHYAFNRKKIDEQLYNEEECETVKKVASFEYDLVAELKKNNVEVVVLDEAHHLRSAWWKSLTSVLKELGDIKTIALTATPPYDAEKGEWDRYLQVCGAIDSEITVPELVATGDLCPHQDFIIFNSLLPDEESQVTEIQGSLDAFVNNLQTNGDFISMLKGMPEIIDYPTNEAKVLENPRYYSSIIIFLSSVNTAVDGVIIKALGGGSAIPKLTMEWLEVLLQGIIYDYKESFAEHSHLVKEIHSRLNDISAIVNGRVEIDDNNKIKKIVASSIGKMESIADIVINEYSALENELSMVILADFVRSEALTDDNYSKMGVVPIFKRIVKDIGVNPNDDNTVVDKICNIAILSGKLKVVPKTIVELVKERIPVCEVVDFPVNGYLQLKTIAKYESELVSLITALMNEKKVNIIIGTVALIGEGWDCQAVNSLVLASVIGSFMLSNQMRGRAIRKDETPDKVANIWHLASLVKNDYNSIGTPDNIDLGDYRLLKRRFKSFIGISYEGELMQSGIKRLNIFNEHNLMAEYPNINKQMYRISRTRRNTKDRWSVVLDKFGGDNIEIVRTLRAEEQALKMEKRFRPVVIREINDWLTSNFFIIGALASVISIIVQIPAITFAGLLFAAIPLIRDIVKRVIYATPASNMNKIATIVLESLKDLGNIRSKYAVVCVKSVKTSGGKAYEVELHNGTLHENNVFITAMRDIYMRIDNPRYLIAYEDKKLLRTTYFSVPSILTDNKSKAEMFYEKWQKYMGKGSLIYTRTEQGRKVLLRARKGSFDYSEKFTEQQQAVKQINWK